MKLDTGADITAIPETAYHRLLRSFPTLSPPDHILQGPDGAELSGLSSFRTSLTLTPTEDRYACHSIYIIRMLQQPLPERPEIHVLGLLTQIDAMDVNCVANTDVAKGFPWLFSGLGGLKGPPHKFI